MIFEKWREGDVWEEKRNEEKKIEDVGDFGQGCQIRVF